MTTPRTRGLFASLVSGRIPSLVGSRDTWPKLVFTGPVLLLAAVVAPGVLVVVSVCRVLLRRRPDRMTAVMVAAGGLVLAALLLLLVGSYAPAWSAVLHGHGSSGDVATVVAWSVLLGVPVGPGWWWLDTWWRERQPMGGPSEASRRHIVEAERRLRVTHRWQSLAHDPRRPEWVREVAKHRAVPTMDGTNGTLIGRKLAGDLDWKTGPRGAVILPEATGAKHIVALGKTGCGKSEFVWLLVKGQLIRKVRADGQVPASVWSRARAVASGKGPVQRPISEPEMVPEPRQVIHINCKQPAFGVAPSERLAKMAADSGRSSLRLTFGVSPWDPMRGTAQRVQQRLMAAQEWSEPWYQDLAAVILALSLELAEREGHPPTSLGELVQNLLQGGLEDLAVGDPRAAAALATIEKKDDQGLVTRLMNQALQLAGWIGPAAVGGWSWEDADVIGVDLPTGTDPGAARMLLRLMLTDLEGWIVEKRRPMIGPRRPVPLTLVLEEVSAFDDDPIMPLRIKNFMERCRDADVQVVIVAHGPHSLGEPRIMASVLDSCMVVTGVQRALDGPEILSGLVGTKRVEEASVAYQPGADTVAGSIRAQHVFKVNPDELRALKTGELIIFERNQWMKVAVAMDDDGYAGEALRAAEIEAAKEAGQDITADQDDEA